jgi:CII-binding regulator of phage lambda lysogenization HflD
VVEALSRKVKKEIELGNLLGLQITRVVKNMNHSQLVDDTLLLGGASIIIASIFKSTVESFLDVFGGAVNNRKCLVYGWNTSPRVM